MILLIDEIVIEVKYASSIAALEKACEEAFDVYDNNRKEIAEYIKDIRDELTVPGCAERFEARSPWASDNG